MVHLIAATLNFLNALKSPRPSLLVQGEERGYGKRDSAVIEDSKESVEKERTETGEVSNLLHLTANPN